VASERVQRGRLAARMAVTARRCDTPGALLPSMGMDGRQIARSPRGRTGAMNIAVLTCMGLWIGGCVEIQGGAVEVPWAIFAPDGHAITDCSCAVLPAIGASSDAAEIPIAYVRLDLDSFPPGTMPCAGLDACRFTCSRKIGATPFMIPQGQYQMSLVPLAADGTQLMDLNPITGPVRPVTYGQPTELEAFTITADCASRCNGGSATQPCSGG
jgi:hypothetical protein